MEACKIRGTTPSHARGLEGKEISSPSGRGRKMPLTSPLIDQAITFIDANGGTALNECNEICNNSRVRVLASHSPVTGDMIINR